MKTLSRDVQDLVILCNSIGKHIPLWVQGAGGNVSVKLGGQLWVKASGVRLSDVSETTGLAQIELDRFFQKFAQASSEAEYAQLLGDPEVASSSFGRPSMEAAFHALLPRKWVMHFHPVSALPLAHSRITEKKSLTWNEDGVLCSVIRWVKPGLELAQLCAKNSESSVLFLESHGVILQGDDLGILEWWKKFESAYIRREFPEWIEKLKKIHSLESCLSELGVDHEGPLNLYFPDTAVFLDRLMKFLVPVAGDSQSWRMPLPLLPRDRDLAEIWGATQILQRMAPELPQIPEADAEAVSGLPTEAFRKQMAR